MNWFDNPITDIYKKEASKFNDDIKKLESEKLALEDSLKSEQQRAAQDALDLVWEQFSDNVWKGRLYEYYIGYLCESKGWQVQYNGVTNGVNDKGRDLICNKGNTVLIVQCKNWSKFQVYENEIYQLAGTVQAYKLDLLAKNPQAKVKVTGVLCTSTSLSPEAKNAAKTLGIKFRENKTLQQFPMVKATTDNNGERRYYVPTDPDYENVVAVQRFNNALSAQNAGFTR